MAAIIFLLSKLIIHVFNSLYLLARYLSEASEGVCIHDNENCLSYGLPRHYITYHLRDKTINIDGKLDDEAWAEVPWTENFVGGCRLIMKIVIFN